MKTLQDCKDLIAQKYYCFPTETYKNWDDMESTLCLSSSGVGNLFARADEAAKEYAKAWIEAAADRVNDLTSERSYYHRAELEETIMGLKKEIDSQ